MPSSIVMTFVLVVTVSPASSFFACASLTFVFVFRSYFQMTKSQPSL